MSELPVRKRVRDGQATREKILLEALRLFARKGFDATSVRDISTAVGVADAALYRHFPSKDDIAAEVFTRHYGNLAQAVSSLAEGAGGFSVALSQLVTLLCDLFDDEPDVFAFILLNQHDHLRFVKEEDNVVSALVSIMRKARDRGEIDIRSAELAASIALGAAIQPAVFCLYGRLPGPLSRHRDRIEEAIAAALHMKSARQAPAM